MSVKEIDAKTAQKLFETDKAILVDVREPAEYAREHIIGARLVPLSGFDGEDFSKDHDKVAIFHCRSGSRTAINAERLLRSGFREVYTVRGGLEAWKRAGLPVHLNRKAPIDLMRQVQIAVGGLVVVGAVLSALVSAWFLLLVAGVGGGLFFAGATGFCGMARMLAQMPWNRVAAVDPAPGAHHKPA